MTGVESPFNENGGIYMGFNPLTPCIKRTDVLKP
jgi:hypothetical protein